MAKGIESNVSDDESDTTSLDDLVELVHEQNGMLNKQANEIKELNALNDLSATLATNYEHLLCKLKLLSKECDDLKSKLESNETKTSNSFDLDESSIPCAILCQHSIQRKRLFYSITIHNIESGSVVKCS
jgi:predicted nuclease with TOPRIM domain